jgi:hypothetical protein
MRMLLCVVNLRLVYGGCNQRYQADATLAAHTSNGIVFAHFRTPEERHDRNGTDYDRGREQSCRSNRAQLLPGP